MCPKAPKEGPLSWQGTAGPFPAVRHSRLPVPRDALPRLSPALPRDVPDPPRMPGAPRCPPPVTFGAVGRAAPRGAAAPAAARHGRGAQSPGAARPRWGRSNRGRRPPRRARDAPSPRGMATERGLAAERGFGPGTVTPQLRRNRKRGRLQGEVGSYENSL